jgi:CTP-dependent riboflavin kinase
MAILTGTVCSGRGLAKEHLAPLGERFRQHLGAMPMPGSLNVLLDRPVSLHHGRSVLAARDRAFWPVSINGVDALAHRWRYCPLHIVEVVSHIPLRRHFGLQDGASVRIDMTGVIAPTPLSAALSWWLIWRGREALFYSKRAGHRLPAA